MSSFAFQLKVTKDYFDLLVLAFKHYLDKVDLSIYVDNHLDEVNRIYNVLVDSNNLRSGRFYFNLCFLYEDDFYIFSDVIEFVLKNCVLDRSTLARFYIMYNKFCADPEGQVIALC